MRNDFHFSRIQRKKIFFNAFNLVPLQLTENIWWTDESKSAVIISSQHEVLPEHTLHPSMIYMKYYLNLLCNTMITWSTTWTYPVTLWSTWSTAWTYTITLWSTWSTTWTYPVTQWPSLGTTWTYSASLHDLHEVLPEPTL